MLLCTFVAHSWCVMAKVKISEKALLFTVEVDASPQRPQGVVIYDIVHTIRVGLQGVMHSRCMQRALVASFS